MDKYLIVALDPMDEKVVLAHEKAARSDIARERYDDLTDRFPRSTVRLYEVATKTILSERIAA